MEHLDPHAKPPDAFKELYRRYVKLPAEDLERDELVVDPRGEAHGMRCVGTVEGSRLREVFGAFDEDWTGETDDAPVWEHPSVPGLYITPSLLPPAIQTTLLTRLLHRDLSNPVHRTNTHLHYTLPSSGTSFFALPRSAPPLPPLDASLHKPLQYGTFLRKKLRWVTLGGQYDWTAKRYPSTPPPPFPPDIAALLTGLYPALRPEAAIVNFYSPGDTLSLHRDVSEECGAGLVSVSVGCEGVFVVGVEEGDEGNKAIAVRLRSGDAVYMTGAARFAWHGVPLVVPGTCPRELGEWPAGREAEYEAWRGWMGGKRVNLNVRQMWE
ncbi:hypothetical protein EJ06DRAFT_559595 [Trichodelitschia bisporula]|uniref:mRNA N(6)-methyladenine demethylase n=1 Tax=Trichodelitschia bisporula TaxID=703511 RepID=A0A6G1HM99_9PEZI|nr:hypothetical protein EJ06DRAFT_559595 [Trichodelitschia bisporula]